MQCIGSDYHHSYTLQCTVRWCNTNQHDYCHLDPNGNHYPLSKIVCFGESIRDKTSCFQFLHSTLLWSLGYICHSLFIWNLLSHKCSFTVGQIEWRSRRNSIYVWNKLESFRIQHIFVIHVSKSPFILFGLIQYGLSLSTIYNSEQSARYSDRFLRTTFMSYHRKFWPNGITPSRKVPECLQTT